MKIKKFKEAAMMLLCAMLVMSVSSCCHDDDDDNNNAISDEQYGEFVIKNISSGEILEGNEPKVIPGDMLVVSFVPSEKYKRLSFELNNKYNSEVIEDTFAIHSSSVKVHVNGKEVESDHKLVLSASAKNDGKEIEVSRIVNLKFYDKSSRVVCSVRAKADLLMFVDPVLSYSDNKGNSFNCRPFEGMTIRRDSLKEDNIKLELANISDKLFRYTQWGCEAEATLSFVKKIPVELTRESYDLKCAVVLSGAAYERDYSPMTISMNISLDINIGGKNEMTDENGKIKKEYVEEYINKLVETTQTKRIKIDENGKVTEIFN